MPPPDIALGDIVQVTIRTTYQTQTYLNVLHYKCENLPNNVAYEAALTALGATLETDAVKSIIIPMRECVGGNVAFNDITLQRVYPTRDYYYRDDIGGTGTHPQDCTTGNISCVITKRSDRAGRGRTGSFHIPGVPEGTFQNGSFLAAYLTLADALANSLDDNQVSGVGGFDVWYPGMFNGALGTPANWSSIISCETRETVRVMRRRTVGVGI